MDLQPLILKLTEGRGFAGTLFFICVVIPALGLIKNEKYGIFSFIGRLYDRWKNAVVAADRLSEARIVHLEEAVKALDAQLSELQKSSSLQEGYIVWITAAAFAWEQSLAAKGVELPPPPRLTFEQWKRMQEKLSPATGEESA